MAVSKLYAVTIAGNINDFDRIVSDCICKQDIHLENVMSVLGDKKELQPFPINAPYESVIQDTENIIKLAKIPMNEIYPEDSDITLAQMREFVDSLKKDSEEWQKEQKQIKKEIEELENVINNLNNIKNINCDISKLNDFKFIKYRFGHIPRSGYKMLSTYLSDMDIVFYKTSEDANGVWGFYFAPTSEKTRVDEIFASLYFERIRLPYGVTGTPQEIVKALNKQIEELNEKIEAVANKARERLKDSEKMLLQVWSTACARRNITYVREKAAHSKELFYIFGWMNKRAAAKLENQLSKDSAIVLFYTQEPEDLKDIISPPTKLKNNIVFRPFESFVKMYGYPAYDEVDPTPLLAFTYILFFGMMFGDVGQSAIFAILGFLVYKKTKMALANIIGIVGISGIVFGFLYGSVFGNEQIIHPILSPMDNITTLLVGTMSMGAVIIIIGMILNVINCCKRHDVGEMLFSHNGMAGIVFYVSVILFALSKITEFVKIPSGLLSVLIAISLLLIFMSEPLTDLLRGKKIPTSLMFYIQKLFELVEILLSYFSNTISFLRIGAFAIVHVGMMMAVSVLATGGSVKSVVVSVLGNILVMVLEGLVVGIQVLRLEYYEMFSRYFTGKGRPFVSLKNIK